MTLKKYAAPTSIVILSSVLLSLLLVLINRPHSAGTILLFLSIGFSASLLIFMAWSKLKNAYNKSLLRNELSRSINSILHYKSCGIPSISAIDKVLSTVEVPELKISLGLIKSRFILGEIPETASRIQTIDDVISGPGKNKIFAEPGELRQIIDSHELAVGEKLSSLEAKSQRNATINMFVSTILPSFIIFAFIGSTIISGSSPSILSFSIIMLAVLPVAYALSYAELSKGLLG